MRSWTIPLAIASCAIGAGAARADQCAWIDGATAARAADALAHHPMVVSFCEACGDAAPGVPGPAGAVGVRPVNGGLSEVAVDGRGIDLAYTYVQTSAHQFRNLAALAGCPTSGVSPSLRVDDATSSGVMIRADDAEPEPVPPPAPAPVAPAPAPVAAAAPPAPAAAPMIFVVSSTSSAPTALLALLLGLGVAFTGSMLWILRSLTRRRPSFTPRAAELVSRRRPPAA